MCALPLRHIWTYFSAVWLNILHMPVRSFWSTVKFRNKISLLIVCVVDLSIVENKSLAHWNSLMHYIFITVNILYSYYKSFNESTLWSLYTNLFLILTVIDTLYWCMFSFGLHLPKLFFLSHHLQPVCNLASQVNLSCYM